MMFRHSKNQSSTSNAFENEFALEVLKSDRLRVTILIGVLISAQVILAGLTALSFEQFQRTFHGNFKGFLLTFALFTGSAVACLIMEGAAIYGNWRRRESSRAHREAK